MKTILFIDSSVLFSAVHSPSGGSSKLFTIPNIELVVTPLILTEVERNIRKKLYHYHLERFFSLAKQLKILHQEPDIALIDRAKNIIVEKDAAILAEAKRASIDILVTLDKKHFFQPKVFQFLKPKKVFLPKELL